MQKTTPGKKHSFAWLRSLSVKNKFSIIIAVIILVLLVELGNFWLSMRVMSGIRDYVGGEGLYTKAQKEANNSLIKYTTSHDEADYQEFLSLIGINLDFKEIRLELAKKDSDYNFVRQKWIKVGIHPDDTADSYFLYKNFHQVIYMKKAVVIWQQADEKVAEFVDVAEKIHTIISMGGDQDNLLALIKQAEDLDDQLSAIEVSFSNTLGEGSRAIANILLLVTVILTLILGALSISIAVLITKMVIQIDRDKGDFIRIANHQLNTPLSIMKNTYSMVEDKSITLEKGFEYLGSGLKRMVNVFEDIKTVLQFEGEVQYDIQKNDIMAAMKDAAHYGERTIMANKKDITIAIEEPDFVVPLVWCDIRQLNNAIHNLLDNAVYYTPQGLITISYEIVDNNFLKVNIKDTGIGFAEEDKDRLGQRFYRSKRALLNHPDGSGLGLYICRNILENNKGKLLFESSGEGQGSTFGFTLPIVK